jgi:hypothetical protein
MGESIRETGRRRARLAAVAVGATSVFGVGAIAAAVYVPAAVQGVTDSPGTGSDTSGSSGGSGTSGNSPDNGTSRQGRHQQYQSGQQGLQSSRGGGAMAHSSGS